MTQEKHTSTPGNLREVKQIPIDPLLKAAAETLKFACHGNAWNAGWWHDIKTGERLKKTPDQCCMLIVTEIAEAYEGARKNKQDEHLKQFDSMTVELADAVIRIFDTAGGLGLPLAEAIVAKMEYNRNRADHKPENRLKDGGKKF